MTEQATQYAGSEWIAAHSYGKDISGLGVVAADLIGDVFLGIYHIETKQLALVDWGDENRICVPVNSSLCTVDFDHLTRLMVLAHDRMIRVEIQGKAKGWLWMVFSQRTTRTGNGFERCPMLEEHVAILRSHYGDPKP